MQVTWALIDGKPTEIHEFTPEELDSEGRIIFHIRRRLPRKGYRHSSSGFVYKVEDNREVNTFCKAPPTSYDATWNDKVSDWENADGLHTPCVGCVEARSSVNRK